LTYHVNAIQTVHPRSAVKDPEKEREKLHAWLKAWDQAAKDLDRPVLFFTYLLDEPNDEKAYREVQTWGRAVREAKSALKVMVVEQTKTQDPRWATSAGPWTSVCSSASTTETAAKLSPGRVGLDLHRCARARSRAPGGRSICRS
jgi:hypothetical protein